MWGFDRIWGIFLLQHSELLVTWYDFFSTRVVEKVATYNLLYSHKYTPLEISRMNRYPKMSLALFTHVCLSLGDLFMKLKNTWNHQSSLLLLNAKIGWCQSVKWRKKHRKTGHLRASIALPKLQALHCSSLPPVAQNRGSVELQEWPPHKAHLP